MNVDDGIGVSAGRWTALGGGIAAAAVIVLGASATVSAQGNAEEPMRAHHGGEKTLFLAQADGGKTVPPGSSQATATAAFLVDGRKRTLSYEITYQGLEQGRPRSIALYNFGEGGNGRRIHTLCGDGKPCPKGTSANLAGSWDGTGEPVLDSSLLSEFASARIYLQIDGGDGKPEIRAQLEPNGAMLPVRNFIAHLKPSTGTDSKGVGTAVVSEAHFPDGRVSVFYSITVAETRGTPTSAALLGVPEAATTNESVRTAARRFDAAKALPEMKLQRARQPAGGATLSGQYEVVRSAAQAPVATEMVARGDREIGISVSTSRFPGGELYGVLEPVR